MKSLAPVVGANIASGMACYRCHQAYGGSGSVKREERGPVRIRPATKSRKRNADADTDYRRNRRRNP